MTEEIAMHSSQAKQLTAQPSQVDKPKRKRGRPPAFKPTQFDWDLMHLLREGTNSADLILEQLGIAKTELFNRIELLGKENLVTEENGEVKLTVNGYNFYSGKGVKKARLKKAIIGDIKPRRQKHSKPKELQPEGQKQVNEWLATTEVVDFGGKLGKMDLQEIMARYGPTSEQKDRFLQRKAMEAVQAKQETVQPPNSTVPFTRPANATRPELTRQSDEMCDLCRSNFSISVSQPELAKYGHCFCGAAYHKDCYDSLLSDSSFCIRCGKKLLLIIDKQSRETIKGLRDVFE